MDKAVLFSRVQRGKSRHGCWPCKTKHLKCDESRPQCGNCLSHRLKCPGYELRLRWSSKHQHSRENSGTAAAVSRGQKSVHARRKNFGATRRQELSLQHNLSLQDEFCVSEPNLEESRKAQEQNVREEPQQVLECSTAPSLLSPVDAEVDTSQRAHNPNLPSNDHDKDADSRTLYRGHASCGAVIPSSQASQIWPQDSAVILNPMDLSSVLIEYWFTRVCKMWSTFDSEVNYNRQLATATWTTSEAVFFSLQAMAASCLVDSLPPLRNILPFLVSQATSAINEKITMLQSEECTAKLHFSLDLVFAVFALGTSLHWAGPKQLGDFTLLRYARNLLSFWKSTSRPLGALWLAYFEQALVYWEMLHSVEGSDSKCVKLEQRRQKHQERLRQVIGLDGTDVGCMPTSLQPFPSPGAFGGTRPNSWCGIASEIMETFGLTISMYRDFRKRYRETNILTPTTSCSVLCDIAVAHELQQEAIAMDFNNILQRDEWLGFSLNTGDENTPIAHHILIAEAYRQASLLQLYLCFDDLEIKFLAEDFSTATVVDTVPRARKLAKLAVNLIKTLEQVPEDSGSNRIQPLLYISAAAGLKFDASGPTWSLTSDADTLAGHDTSRRGATNTSELSDMDWLDFWHAAEGQSSGHVEHPIDSEHTSRSVVSTISQLNWELFNARRFITTRLDTLKRSLPPRPVQVAANLVKAIWAAYDSNRPGADTTHWVDVLEDTGLQTLFG